MSINSVLIDLSAITNWPQLAAEVHYQAPLLAERWHVNMRKLQREFRIQLHTTPQKHLDSVRASMIKELACQKIRTKEIRVRLEYKRDFQVCRQFLTVFGVSLKTYRQTIG
jgi:AraC-like DNA-binding protein